MRAILSSGATLTGPFKSMTTGYVAMKIEIYAEDVQDMINMLAQSPEKLRVHLEQLHNRFEGQRAEPW